MSKKLVICEKPSVSRDVVGALPETFTQTGDAYESDHWVVSHAVGHLLEQVAPEAYDVRFKKWTYEDLPIIPETFRYQARDARSRKQLSALHALMNRDDVDTIVNACDAGREGELIFKLIRQSASKRARDKPVQRAWFSSMTKSAIRDAFGALRPDADMIPLEDAAYARSEADWLVGMNGTRAATTRAGSMRSVLSLGRVQTPTLAMIARRDLEIAAFVPQKYWQIDALLTGADSDLPAVWNDVDGTHPALWFTGPDGKKHRDRIVPGTAADSVAATVSGAAGVVRSVDAKHRQEVAPLLYDLTALQRDANQRFGFSATRTLKAAQSCYDEHKVLTYPRTSSRYLSSDMVGQLTSVVDRVGAAAPEYADAARSARALASLPLGRVVNDAKITDHHAIIPTDDVHNLSRLGGDARRIYDMVARRFLAVFLPPAKLKDTVVITDVQGHTFRSSGTVIVEPGWYAVDAMRRYRVEKQVAAAVAAADEDGEEEANDRTLPSLEVGQRLTCAMATVHAKSTKPPARYNEGSLLKSMETAGKLVEDDEAAEAMKDGGLGTPATRANIIESLIDREYVEREGKQLRATDKAIGLISMLGDHLLTSPELTGRWEQKLNEVQRGAAARSDFHDEIVSFTRQVVEWFADKGRDDLRVTRTVVAPCPLTLPDGTTCSGNIVEQRKSYSCDSYHGKADPGCGYTLWKQSSGGTITMEQALTYIAAGTQSTDLEAAREVIGVCPTDGCDGDIIDRNRSYGCTSWTSKAEPGCGYVIWKRVRGKQGEVTPEEATGMVARGETNATPPRAPVAECPVPGCGGMIVDRPKTYGCNSWKSPRNRGCGYVIWKTSRDLDHEMTVDEARQKIRTDSADPAAAGLSPVAGRKATAPRTKRGTADADGTVARHLLERAIWTGLDGGEKVTLEIPAGSYVGLPDSAAAGLIANLSLDAKPLKLWSTVKDSPAATRATLEQRLQERVRIALAPTSRPTATTAT
ncbi:MAG: DNA topoisomerase III [Thermoleophilia bacterium]|nr:DNA topoisomerase III [Thermoleophilia bacterium]